MLTRRLAHQVQRMRREETPSTTLIIKLRCAESRVCTLMKGAPFRLGSLRGACSHTGIRPNYTIAVHEPVAQP